MPRPMSAQLLVIKKYYQAVHQWLTPVILAAQEGKIRRIEVRTQPQANLSLKIHHKKRTGGVAQGVGPEFKPQHHRKKKEKKKEKILSEFSPKELGI
jgi:hypothetical protein